MGGGGEMWGYLPEQKHKNNNTWKFLKKLSKYFNHMVPMFYYHTLQNNTRTRNVSSADPLAQGLSIVDIIST